MFSSPERRFFLLIDFSEPVSSASAPSPSPSPSPPLPSVTSLRGGRCGDSREKDVFRDEGDDEPAAIGAPPIGCCFERGIKFTSGVRVELDQQASMYTRY